MNRDAHRKLMGVSAATPATALFKRGLRSQVVQDVRPVAPKGRNMVGPAFTLRCIPARGDRNRRVGFRNPKHPQRVAIETCPGGHVRVMDSRKDPRAASAGDSFGLRGGGLNGSRGSGTGPWPVRADGGRLT